MTGTQTASSFAALVETALDELRPMLRRDGGDVEFLGAQSGVVTVRLKGHCADCPMSQQTLKAGVEAHLKARLPEVLRVEQESTTSAPQASASDATPALMCPVAHRIEDKPTATSTLRAEHRMTRASLNILENALERIGGCSATGAQTGMADAKKTFEHLSGTFARHMDYEEKQLFKSIEPFIKWGNPIQSLLREHDDLRGLISEFGKCLKEHTAAEQIAAQGAVLISAIRQHLYREENTVYFEADATFDAAGAPTGF